MNRSELIANLLKSYSHLCSLPNAEHTEEQWKLKLKSEISYWSNTLNSDVNNTAKAIPPELYRFLNRDLSTKNILDLGSGPFPLKIDGAAVTAADPLAKEFSDLLSEKGLPVPSPFFACTGETIQDHCKSGSFDLVVASRCIDQCYSPADFIRGMLQVCRPGGQILISISGVWNPFNNLKGARNWNIIASETDLLLWRTGKCYSLRDLLSDQAELTLHTISKDTVVLNATRLASDKNETHPNYAEIYDSVYSSAKTYTASHTSPGLRTALSMSDKLLTAGPRHLDVGAGPGYLVEVMSMPPFRKHSVGVDISAVATDLAAKRMGPGKVLQMENGKLPFSEDTFDVITCFDVMEHLDISDARVLIAEMRRVARPGALGLLNISLRDSNLRDMNGDSVHRSILSATQWDNIINFDRYSYTKRESELLGEILF